MNREDLADKVRVFFLFALGAVFVFQIIGAFAAKDLKHGILFLGLNLVLGGAAGLLAAVVGFIFGIPRGANGRVGRRKHV